LVLQQQSHKIAGVTSMQTTKWIISPFFLRSITLGLLLVLPYTLSAMEEEEKGNDILTDQEKIEFICKAIVEAAQKIKANTASPQAQREKKVRRKLFDEENVPGEQPGETILAWINRSNDEVWERFKARWSLSSDFEAMDAKKQ
jgi:hypothetical protein